MLFVRVQPLSVCPSGLVALSVCPSGLVVVRFVLNITIVNIEGNYLILRALGHVRSSSNGLLLWCPVSGSISAGDQLTVGISLIQLHGRYRETWHRTHHSATTFISIRSVTTYSWSIRDKASIGCQDKANIGQVPY